MPLFCTFKSFLLLHRFEVIVVNRRVDVAFGTEELERVVDVFRVITAFELFGDRVPVNPLLSFAGRDHLKNVLPLRKPISRQSLIIFYLVNSVVFGVSETGAAHTSGGSTAEV